MTPGLFPMALVEGGHIPPPDPAGPGPFSMASPDRTRTLLEGAGFSAVRTEEVPGRFVLRDVDEYLSVIADTAGPLALALRGLSADGRDTVKTQLEDALTSFTAERGYELPALALCAVAS